MFQPITYSSDKQRGYEQLLKQLDALLQGEEDAIANLANASSLLNQFLTDINWVGFYIWKDDELVRSEEHTSELQSRFDLVCRLRLVKKIRICALAYYCC